MKPTPHIMILAELNIPSTFVEEVWAEEVEPWCRENLDGPFNIIYCGMLLVSSQGDAQRFKDKWLCERGAS
uniref:Uncharacterized protein n=1 Tax=Magnetococcus massalia (strain MO-1) TaxID=451514 RepID=A0A1S7LKQ3_MAGMO|nr:protein of unknown function [Candidatus Magnetococcus massalia]